MIARDGSSPAVRLARPGFLALMAASLAACQPEEKVIGYKPFFSGLSGVTGPGADLARSSQAPGAAAQATEDDLKIVVENPDGTKKLVIRNGRDLMAHIQRTLAEDDAKTFADQVLSKVTRDEFAARGLDPREAFTMLKPYERDVARLFARMPMGEHTPNARMDPVGRNVFRVKLTGKAADGVGRWIGFDMVFEAGQWRLRWFVPEGE
jgi:hypothetical protein